VQLQLAVIIIIMLPIKLQLAVFVERCDVRQFSLPKQYCCVRDG
jgi:hypothetical protein